MVRSTFFRPWCRATLALVLGCLTASAALGQDSKGKRDTQAGSPLLRELNQLTGRDTMQAKLKWLLAHPAEGKKVLAEAVPLVKKNDGSVDYYTALILARVARSQKNLPACETLYRYCMKSAADMFSETLMLESYGGLSDVYMEHRKYAEAALVCKDLFQFQMDDREVLPVVRNAKGDVTVTQRPDPNFDPASRIKSVFIRSYIIATAKSGKVDEALETIDKLLDSNDNSWALYQLRGQVLHAVGKYEDAIRAYDNALERIAKDKNLKDDDRAELKETCRYIESSIYADMGKVNRSTEILEDLLKAKPDNAGYLNDLGYILADHGLRLEEAEKMIRKALDLEREKRKKDADLTPDEDHDSGAYLDSLGWTLYKEKKFKEAKVVMLKAVADKATQHIEIYDHLGDVLEALGEHDPALAAWRKAIEVAGDSRRDKELKEKVQTKIDKQKK